MALRKDMVALGKLIGRAATEVEGKEMVATMCGRAKCMYPLRHVTGVEEDMNELEQPIKHALKHACGLPSSFPDRLWYGSQQYGMVGNTRWWVRVMCEKLKMVLQAMWSQRWQGCRGTMRAWCRRLAENKDNRRGALSMGGGGGT